MNDPSEPRRVYPPKGEGHHPDMQVAGGEEITLSDLQLLGLHAAMRDNRATAVRINVRLNEGKKTTEVFFTTFSHESGWSELGTVRPSGVYKLDPETDQWRSP